jgi:dipeptidase E
VKALGHIVISGGGDANQTREIDRHFASILHPELPLLYIPVAMELSVASYESCYEWITGVFRPLGIDNIEMWTDLEHKSVADLQNYSGIYLGGGNTFHLLRTMNGNHFSNVIKTYLKNGGTIYGGSAGGIVLGSHIMTAENSDSNKDCSGDYAGLQLVGKYAIQCHYEEDDRSFILSFINRYQLPVIGLSEETGLSIQDQRIRVIGNKEAAVYDEKEIRVIGIGDIIL